MITFKIQDHEINFTRQAMNAAHQAFPREFAEWNLALFQKGKALVPGVTVREIAPVEMTEGDRLGIGKPVRIPAGTGAPAPMPRPGANAPTPAPQPVDADKYEPVGTVPVVGDVLVMIYQGRESGRGEITAIDNYIRWGGGRTSSPDCCDPNRAVRSSVEFRILKRPVANALEGAEVFVSEHCTDNPRVLHNGTHYSIGLSRGEVVAQWDAWSERRMIDAGFSKRITGTPAAKEALASLARWMEAN